MPLNAKANTSFYLIKLCIQLNRFVLMLTLQAQDDRVPQEPLGIFGGADYCKSTGMENCCSITVLFGEKNSLGPRNFLQRGKINVLQ